MGLPVLHKRASDLFGPYVGQSEQQIAAAFAEARDAAAFLCCALVRKRTRLLEDTPKPEGLVAELAAESAGREGSRRIGFAT